MIITFNLIKYRGFWPRVATCDYYNLSVGKRWYSGILMEGKKNMSKDVIKNTVNIKHCSI